MVPRTNPAVMRTAGGLTEPAASVLDPFPQVSASPAWLDRRINCPSATAESALTFEDRHSAWLAGVDYGMAQRVEQSIENRARELLHQWGLESLGLARRSARHGPAFSKLVRESGERP